MNPIKEYIIEHVDIPNKISKHITAALGDLYYGPKEPNYWREEEDDDSLSDYSFIDSCNEISEWFDSLDVPEFIDEDGCPVNDAESVDYYNEHGIDYYEMGEANLKRQLFGELSPYIK